MTTGLTPIIVPCSPAPAPAEAIAFDLAGHPICYDVSAAYAAGHTEIVIDGNFTIYLGRENTQKNTPTGKPARLIFHWSAGNYNQCWDSYQYCTVYNPATGRVYIIKCLAFTEEGQHLWDRNTGSIGMSLCAMAYKVPVIDSQVSLIARLGAEYCCWHNIDPRAIETTDQKLCNSAATDIWNTGKQIKMSVINDHATYAIADGYGLWRVDIGKYMPVVLHELLDIYDELKAGKTKFQLLDIIK